MERFLETFFKYGVMAQYLPDILTGVGVALWIALWVVITGVSGGLFLACCRAYQSKLGNFFIICFADVLRALPPLVLILILYFGLPGVGIRLSGNMVLLIVLGLTLAAFAEEIFWAGLSAIDKGQWEAGASTGLSFGETLVYIALPQAVRLALPPLVNRVLAITKMTALGSVIGVSEILSAATTAQSFSGSATPLTMSAIAYLIIFLPLVFAARMFERHQKWGGR